MSNTQSRRSKSASAPFWSGFPQTRGRDPTIMKKFSFLDGELEEEHHSRIADYVCTLSTKVNPEVIRRMLAAISLCLSSIGTIKEFIRNVRSDTNKTILMLCTKDTRNTWHRRRGAVHTTCTTDDLWRVSRTNV